MYTKPNTVEISEYYGQSSVFGFIRISPFQLSGYQIPVVSVFKKSEYFTQLLLLAVKKTMTMRFFIIFFFPQHCNRTISVCIPSNKHISILITIIIYRISQLKYVYNRLYHSQRCNCFFAYYIL